jgi:hypothetical protein
MARDSFATYDAIDRLSFSHKEAARRAWAVSELLLLKKTTSRLNIWRAGLLPLKNYNREANEGASATGFVGLRRELLTTGA